MEQGWRKGIIGANKTKKTGIKSIFLMKKLTFLLLLALFASSCRTVKTITVHDVRDSIVYKTITDSFTLLQHDSVFIRQKGDTVFYSKFKTIYKDHIKSDTLRVDVVKIKEVPVNVETIKYKVPKWCWWLVGFNLLALIISFLYWYIKK